jgi:hypothetical protein
VGEIVVGRKKHNTSNYGVSHGGSVALQLLGGAMVVIAVLLGLLAINGYMAGI